jgi:hypothetical protein
MMNRKAWLCWVMFFPAALWSQTIRPLADNGQSFEQRKAAIERRWNSARPVFSGTSPYETSPSVRSPFRAGKLRADYLQDALNAANMVRFLAGLPDVLLWDAYTTYAQSAAVLNASYNAIGYQQAQPAGMDDSLYASARKGVGESNLGQSFASLSQGITIDWAQNSAGRSHLSNRRGILSPGMGYTGFGQAGNFFAMYTADKARETTQKYDAICYPGGAAFPADFFSGVTPWSVTLNPDLYQTPDENALSITMIEGATGKTWRFFKSSDNFFTVNTARYGGVPNCIIFLPSGVNEYTGAWRVEITGLRMKNGNPAMLSYSVRFFNFEMSASASDFDVTVNQNAQMVTINKYRGTQKKLTIPETIDGLPVTTIGKEAFERSSVSEIVLPSSLISIEENAFWYSNIQEVTIPKNVKIIGPQAFYKCASLIRVIIPAGVSVGRFAFAACDNLVEVITPRLGMAASVKMDYGVFMNSPKIQNRAALINTYGNAIFGR